MNRGVISNKVDRLREKLALLRSKEEIPGYVYDMWIYALDNILKSKPEIPQSASCDAVPYLPSELDSYLAGLTEASVLLDIGCLGGYGLFDVAVRRHEAGLPVPSLVGVDIDDVSVGIGRKMADIWVEDEEVDFRKCSIEDLSFEDEYISLVIARLVLPCVRVDDAMK